MAYKNVNGKLVKVVSKGRHLSDKNTRVVLNEVFSDDQKRSIGYHSNEHFPKENNADKGLKNGSCNRTACQKPGATYFNKSTKAYYCEDCARAINWAGGRADCMALYGVPLLCEHED